MGKKIKKKKAAVDPEQKALKESRALARALARLADDRRCRDVKVLELAQRSPVTNHFVIATGTSRPQIRAVARECEQEGQKQGFKVFGRAGLEQGRWAVVDFVDVVLHLFDEEFRRYYDLELLWGDAPKIYWKRKSNLATKSKKDSNKK